MKDPVHASQGHDLLNQNGRKKPGSAQSVPVNINEDGDSVQGKESCVGRGCSSTQRVISNNLNS